MTNPDNQFVVFEDYDLNAPEPKQLHFGRLIAESGRKAINKYTLKKRKYIATTSMDAELSLVTANLALAAAGKLCYDPFMGTGSFPLACAHFGACVFGSDLDGRSVRGKKGRNVLSNFQQYSTSSQYLGGFVADLTNTPLRSERSLDAILCDPPYGVREGLKVLGSHKPALQDEVTLEDGTLAHLAETYVPPKKPYSFLRMLSDILDFSSAMLVDGGRLCMWMPVAGVTAEDDGEEDGGDGGAEYAIPQHPALELVSECTQHFNKWSRRLLTYRRRRDSDVDEREMLAYQAERLELQNGNGVGSADDLNSFRRKVCHIFHQIYTTLQESNCKCSTSKASSTPLSLASTRSCLTRTNAPPMLWSQLFLL
jgi:tRNA (guanine10-N2)-methyltransferase